MTEQFDFENQAFKAFVNENIVHNASELMQNLPDMLPSEDYFSLYSQDDWEEPALYHLDNLDCKDNEAQVQIVEDYNTLLVEDLDSTDPDVDVYRCFKELKEFIEESDNNAQEYCELNNLDPHIIEALEHWIVSDWLAEKLEKQGEMIGEVFGLNIWGRACSGQWIGLDYSIQKAYMD